jgi:hypothetical protein
VSTQDDKQEENTLTGFIKEQEKLITGIGIFAALTAFFTSRENGAILVIFSYLIFLLLCVELMTHFPSFRQYFNLGLKSFKLCAFHVLLLCLVVGLCGYVIYYQPVIIALATIIFLIVSIFYSDQIQTQGNTYLDNHHKTGKVVRFLMFVGFAFMFLFLAILAIAVIFQVLSHFGIVTLPTPP